MILLHSGTYRSWREGLGLTRAKAESLLNELVAEGLARFDVMIYGGHTVVEPTERGKEAGRAP
jgi:hypothetical protein